MFGQYFLISARPMQRLAVLNASIPSIAKVSRVGLNSLAARKVLIIFSAPFLSIPNCRSLKRVSITSFTLCIAKIVASFLKTPAIPIGRTSPFFFAAANSSLSRKAGSTAAGICAFATFDSISASNSPNRAVAWSSSACLLSRMSASRCS
ncbi:hypothetical protein B484DRAFT_460282, partial [Ochromonadaceae sp. CCMP2298]